MDPLAFLFSLERLGMKFGLENMTLLCAALDHPERTFTSLLVAGTNGKGSVTAMAAAALDAAGHRAARYTSPHLERIEERFVIAGREVTTAELRAAAGVVQSVVAQLLRDGALAAPPTFFECATAIAFELFRRSGVTIAVLEVGLGGRLDATNVVSPVAAAITSIGLDHQALLGDDVASIAREKAGIIKPGIPVVCGPLPPAAAAVIGEVCAARGARLVRALDEVRVRTRVEDGETVASLTSGSFDLPEVRLALRGRHQVANAAVAVCLIEAAVAAGFAVPASAMRSALATAQWPGRLERLTWQGAEVLLDAAHNPAGATALAEYMADIGWTGVTLIVGVMRDKDAAGILAPLLPRCARLCVTAADGPRALPAGELAALARQLSGMACPIETFDQPEAALRAACTPRARVVVAGSIFLVGPLRGILR